MDDRIFDSELKLMELIWEQEGSNVTAKELSRQAEESIGWNKNTTYTILKKLVEKGYVERQEPGFICRALISRETVQQRETKGLLNRIFGGSRKALFSALLEEEALDDAERADLLALIEKR